MKAGERERERVKPLHHSPGERKRERERERERVLASKQASKQDNT